MASKTAEQFAQESYREAIDSKFVLREKLATQGVLLLTLNRPKRANGFTNGMYMLLSEYVEEASKDDQTRVIILRGDGKHFCSGNDLGNFSKVQQVISESNADVNAKLKEFAEFNAKYVLQRVTEAFRLCKKPIIALVQGAAIGIGFTLLGLCDIVYATQSARF